MGKAGLRAARQGCAKCAILSGSRSSRRNIMSIARCLAVTAACCALAVPAAAQLANHKELSYNMIKAIAEGAVEACQAKGYHVSVTVVGRDGGTLAQIRGDGA